MEAAADGATEQGAVVKVDLNREQSADGATGEA